MPETWLEIVAVYDGTNNGYIAASNRVIGDRINVAHTTIGRAITMLITLGFLEIAKKSDFSAKTRIATEYRLTHLKCDRTSTPPAKTFMRLGTVQMEPPASSTLAGTIVAGRPN